MCARKIPVILSHSCCVTNITSQSPTCIIRTPKFAAGFLLVVFLWEQTMSPGSDNVTSQTLSCFVCSTAAVGKERYRKSFTSNQSLHVHKLSNCSGETVSNNMLMNNATFVKNKKKRNRKGKTRSGIGMGAYIISRDKKQPGCGLGDEERDNQTLFSCNSWRHTYLCNLIY